MIQTNPRALRHLPRLIFALLALATGAFAAAPGRLNVILVTADDLGLQVGSYGDPISPTPNLDALAMPGVKFRDAWVVQSSCSPSRSALLTGLWPHQNGQVGLVNGGFAMRSGVTTLPARLKAAGFATGIIGKLHVDPPKAFSFDMAHSQHGVSRHVPNVAQWAGAFFAMNREKPFFLMVNYRDPHRPFVPDAVSYRLTTPEIFSGLRITNVVARNLAGAGIALGRVGKKPGTLADYRIVGNLATVAEDIKGARGTVADNLTAPER